MSSDSENLSQSEDQAYTLEVCPHCKKRAYWEERTRGGFGWYCRHHQYRTTHPANFYGYLNEVESIEVVRVSDLERKEHSQPTHYDWSWERRKYRGELSHLEQGVSDAA